MNCLNVTRNLKSIRFLSIASKVLTNQAPTVGSKLNSLDELQELFSKPTWNTNDLLVSTKATGDKVDTKVLSKLLNLSGLSTSLTSKDSSKLLISLNDQLNFINQLHSIELSDIKATEPKITRLMMDNCKDDTLNYDDLISEIETEKPNLLKGELENSWNSVSLSSQHEADYFVVNEGLIKKNKQ